MSYQDGRLSWKPGEEGYRTWLRRINPDPKGDARKIAGIFNEAQKTGAIKGAQVGELADVIQLLNSTSAGNRPMLHKAGNLSIDELRAAARYLRYETGFLRVVDR